MPYGRIAYAPPQNQLFYKKNTKTISFFKKQTYICSAIKQTDPSKCVGKPLGGVAELV